MHTLTRHLVRSGVRRAGLRFARPASMLIRQSLPTSRRFLCSKHDEIKPQKTSTGIPGLEVNPLAREILIRMYERYLEDLKQFEEGTPYRSHMEKSTKYRLEILRSTEDVFEIEEKIGMGQIEELIDEQEKEFKLVPFMLEHKPWESHDKWDTKFYLYSNVK